MRDSFDRTTTPPASVRRVCSICGQKGFVPLATRSDGAVVVQCIECQMGVLDRIPEDLSVFYGDDYYGKSGQDDAQGYEDYNYTAEHGVSWAAALLKLLCPAGAVLDIGCANGYLLNKLGPEYARFGIEANAAMCRIAEAQGVTILGRDLLAAELRAAHAGRFDAITAIAVFEHLRDIRGGFEAALAMLREEGVLLFEVPLISARHDNTVWFTSSLEHVWYPSETGLRQLVEGALGCHLVGSEVHIRGYGSNYVGIVVRDAARAEEIGAIAARVLTCEADAVGLEEQRARMQIRMIHAATTTHADVGALAAMPPEQLNAMMLRRIAELWQADLWRLHLAEEENHALRASHAEETARRRDLEGKIDALSHDAARNEVELTREIVSLKERLQAAAPDVAARGLGDPAVPVAPAAPAAESGGPAAMGANTASAANIDAAPADVSVVGATLKVMEATGHRPCPFDAVIDPWPDDRPLVSVVIPSFNYGAFVEEAVESVLAQTLRNVEVIVVEGGSSDGPSRLRVAELDRARVRVLMQGERHHAAANRNFGISQARGKYVCCLDADDKLRPTYLEKAVFLLERHDFDVVSAAMEMFGARTGILPIAERPDLDTLLQDNHCLTCAVFRRDLWERAGGFRDTDRTITGHVHEDWAFWVRLAALGARFINLAGDPMLLYRVHGASLSRGPDVLPMDRQRELVGMMNADVITPEARERSRRLAAARRATPLGALPKIALESAAAAAGAAHRPTVVLAMPFLILGGAERLVSSVVAHLTARGWRVVVMTSIEAGREHGDATPWFEPHTAEIFHLPRFLPREYWSDFLRHLVASRAVDILWLAGSAFVYDNLRSLRAEFPRLKVVDLLFNTQGHTENNRRRRHEIDRILVENEEVRAWLVEHGEAGERIRLIESGVDLDRLHPGLRSAAFRARIAQGPADIIVGFSGRWSQEKDPLAFVAMARRADPAWPVRFVMTGAGPLGPEIGQAIAAAAFPPGRFHLLGEVPDIAAVLASIDVLVVPSRLDGRPMVVLEALAVGTPVLASRVGGLPALIDAGETGWLCAPGDVDAFLSCIHEAAMSPDRLARMRSAARASAEARLDARRMRAAYEAALSELLPEDRRLRPEARPQPVMAAAQG